MQRAVLQFLALHEGVAWAVRMNVGALKISGQRRDRFIKFAFRGCSDLIGQMKDGRFLAVECKRPGGRPTPEQAQFLKVVVENGGVGGVVEGLDDVQHLLETN